ncbi:hypothetical protein J5288_08265 [Agrobacterium sp. S2/73]|uniref:hypothetical protein n=1 Tax=unclassified Agrobacterium TaxID=2632611 RepID=UPI001ADCB73E|nr:MULTISPECIES: hypothetical protein [unclassified Agrobacterium]MBO9108695.1 hypothetical protein [Agrobacterium sp. S2/73]QXZ73545.1 hypothetical protein J5276_06245 [Agrobacterium sp. S7/73]
MRDLVHNIGLTTLIPPAVLAADNVPVAVDLLGFNQAVIAVHTGVGGITFNGTNKIDFTLTHSDDNTTFVPVETGDVQGVDVLAGGIVLPLRTAQADPKVTKLGYVGNKRYLKLLADFSGTHGTGTAISALLIKGQAAKRPVA